MKYSRKIFNVFKKFLPYDVYTGKLDHAYFRIKGALLTGCPV